MSVRLEECAASMLAALLASTFAHTGALRVCFQFAIFLVHALSIHFSSVRERCIRIAVLSVRSEKKSPLAAHLFEDDAGVIFASCTEEVCAFMRLSLGVLLLRHILPPM